MASDPNGKTLSSKMDARCNSCSNLIQNTRKWTRR
jgi:hypothetical protein